MFAQNHVLQAATEANALKARAQKGEFSACFEAFNSLLDYWAQGHNDNGTALVYFEAALSWNPHHEPPFSSKQRLYDHFKANQVLPSLLQCAEDSLKTCTYFRAPYQLNTERRPLSDTFDALTRHQISALYDLYLAHARQPSAITCQHAKDIKASLQSLKAPKP